MGRHVAGNCPELDRLVDDACAEIGREIATLAIPRLAGVVLGGGYGRGEGGAIERGMGNGERGTAVLSNDLDFFAITEDGVPEAETLVAIGEALKPVAEKWTKRLEVDVDFAVKTPWRLKHDEERIMVQELVHGYCDVCGAKGEILFRNIERREPSAFPWMEAARLMMNRGMGLLFAKCKVDGASAAESRMSDADRAFVNRNINKCILGAGDAFLVSRGLYNWRVEDRASALAAQGDDGLYARAVEWKFRPTEKPVCDLEMARETWLNGYLEVIAAVGDGDYSRTIRNAARWIARRRSIGDLRTFGRDPVVRVLEKVEKRVRERRAPDSALLRDWQVFN